VACPSQARPGGLSLAQAVPPIPTHPSGAASPTTMPDTQNDPRPSWSGVACCVRSAVALCPVLRVVIPELKPASRSTCPRNSRHGCCASPTTHSVAGGSDRIRQPRASPRGGSGRPRGRPAQQPRVNSNAMAAGVLHSRRCRPFRPSPPGHPQTRAGLDRDPR
jgi:hypothetical protein